MPEFTIDAYRFDIIDHSRKVADGVVIERFIVDAFYQGEPLAWHPNQQGSEDYPGIPNRTNYEFAGRETVPIFGGGTKRGADFRTRLFPILVRRARKAHAAGVLGKTIGDVTDAEIDKAAFVEPVNLKAESIDKCVEILSGKTVQK